MHKPRLLQVTSLLLGRADPFMRIGLAFSVAAAVLKVGKNASLYNASLIKKCLGEGNGLKCR